MTITINGHEDVEPGCYIAGHHGQYGLDMLGDVVEQFGYVFEHDDEDDPRYWRRVSEAESADEAAIVSNGPGRIGNHLATPEECFERQVWAADKLEEWLNEHTQGGSWTWEDGEFYLLDDRTMECDKCGRIGNREDGCAIGEECPSFDQWTGTPASMEDCDGTIHEWAGYAAYDNAECDECGRNDVVGCIGGTHYHCNRHEAEVADRHARDLVDWSDASAHEIALGLDN